MKISLPKLVALLCAGALTCIGQLALAQQLAVSILATPATCVGYTNSSLIAQPTGGQAPYTVVWNDGNSDLGRYGVAPGNYSLIVTDALGNTASASESLSAPTALVLTAAPDGNTCTSGSIAFDLSTSGGSAPYSYQIDGQPVGTRLTNVTPGYHFISVTDSNGCSANTGIQVSAPLSVTVRVQNVVCHGDCDAVVEARVEGGTAPFTYLWSNGATTQQVYGLDPGTYTVTVTDASGCTATASGTATEPAPITFTVDIENPCVNGTFVNVTATGGTGMLTIRWSTGAIGPRVYLEDGQHYVYIRDENGCEVSQAVLISTGIQAVTTMNVDATCDSLGRSLLCITGGRGPFTYRWSDGQTGIQAVNLVPGVYTFVIIDGAGCRFEGMTEIFGPSPASCLVCEATSGSLTGGMTTATICNPPLTITATVANQPTVPAGYTVLYLLTSGNGQTIVQTSASPSFQVTAAGSYTIHTFVYDPSTFDLNQIVLGNSQINSILLLIRQGAGTICAAVDVTGTTFVVPPCVTCNPSSGSLTGGSQTAEACGQIITLTATQVDAPSLPAGFAVLYLLTDASGLIIQKSTTPSFDVTLAGQYRIQTLVYDPNTLDPNTIIPGQTQVATITGIIQTGVCASLDPSGTLFTVPPCNNPEGCVGGTPASLRGVEVCFDGSAAALTPTTVTPASVPPGYLQVYLLISRPAGIILAQSTTPNFNVTTVGGYEIRSLVYSPDSLNLSTAITFGTTTLGSFSSSLRECQNLSNSGAIFNVAPFDPNLPSALASVPCPGQTIRLNPGADTSLTYLWSPATGLSNPNVASPFATLNQTTVYQVQISRMINGVSCSATKPYRVEVSGLPSINAIADVTTCATQNVTLRATTLGATSLIWSTDSTFSTVVSSADTLNVSSGAPTTYYLRATNANGCTTETSVNVGNFPIQLIAGDDQIICAGDEAMLDVTTVIGNPSSFVLLNAAGQQVAANANGIFNVAPGANSSYQIIATNSQGCADTASVNVEVSSVSTALFAGMTMDTSVYPGNEVDLTAISGGASTFTFDPGESYLSRADSSAVVMPEQTTTYSVTATNALGCTATASLTVTVLDFVCDRPFLFVPNAFTPDADGVNDVFFVDGINVTSTYYAIFNRWGQLVFEGSELGDENGGGWDGSFNGQMVDSDVYGVYVRILCRDGEEFYTQGNITVIR